MNESPREDVASSFVYPLTSLCGGAVLLGLLLREGFAEGGWWVALSQACIVSFSLLACFWLSSWLANEVRARYLSLDSDMPACFMLVGYSMAVSFALVLFTGLFPELVIIRYVLQFYVVYVVWLGADTVMKIEENKRMTFSLIVAGLVLFIPFLFSFIFDRLSEIVV